MAITNTKQAKEFTAGAPNIILKGDLRPLNTMAYGGRAQYGLGSFVKSIGRGVKKAVKGVAKGVKNVAKSDLGKTAMAAAALYYAPALFKGKPGFGPGSTYRNFFSQIGQGTAGASPFRENLFGNFIPGQARPESSFLGKITESIGLPSLSKKAKGTLASFAIGSLGSAALSAAEAGGLEYEDPNAEIDLESLQGYLSRGYKNLNPNATDEEVFQFVQENTAEYRSIGGRIGYDNGGYTFEQFMKDKGKVDSIMNEGKMRKLYEEMMRKKKVQEQKTMAAEGGRIGYESGSEYRKKSELEKNVFLQGGPSLESLLMSKEEKKKNKEKIRKQLQELGILRKAKGGRIGYAMGDTASENAMQAAGIEGLPVRQNKAGVTELDLRETGGFVPPVGIKEKADDIPAMLSNNEFVFTADAVRAAGGGNINKGAQIMYDTMKKLESRVG